MPRRSLVGAGRIRYDTELFGLSFRCESLLAASCRERTRKMNKPKLVSETDMPDVAMRELQNPQGTLDWVGMSDVHQPLKIRDGHEEREVQARVQIYVNLDDMQAKGIHMSRLYLILDEHSSTRPLTVAGLKLLLSSLLESHRGLSTNAFIPVSYTHLRAHET